MIIDGDSDVGEFIAKKFVITSISMLASSTMVIALMALKRKDRSPYS